MQERELSTTPSGRNGEWKTKHTLLGLPAELRNKIYYYALTKLENDNFGNNHIEINPSSHKEPGLLRVCSQTRNEASPIYFNQFIWLIVEDTALPLAKSHWFWKKVDLEHRHIIFEGRCDWTKLRIWFKMCHGGEFMLPGFYGGDAAWETIQEAFCIAIDTRESSWESAELVLRSFKRGVDLVSQGGYALSGDWD